LRLWATAFLGIFFVVVYLIIFYLIFKKIMDAIVIVL